MRHPSAAKDCQGRQTHRTNKETSRLPPDSVSLEIAGEGLSLSHSVEEGTTTLGRSMQNDLVLDSDLVSRAHALIQRSDGSVSVTDLESSNGTSVNGQKLVPREAQSLQDGDVITIEPFSLTVKIAVAPINSRETIVATPEDSGATAIAAAPPRSEAPPARPQPVPIPPRQEAVPPPRQQEESAAPPRRQPPVSQPPAAPSPADTGRSIQVTIGRSPESDLWLDDPLVSRRHARIVFERPQQALIEDLGSSNGTFVDGQRVASGTLRPLNSGANIWIGNTHLIFDGANVHKAGNEKSIRVDAIELNKLTSKGANLLQNISLTIEPQEFVVIVGPSGAGKSTLSGALSGLWPATDGHVYVNGIDLYENFDALRTNIGFVPQDDIIHRELPVRASLDYAAQLRLPADTSEKERRDRVDTVINVLGLQERQDVPVGSLSGGQRKRVSIGVELLTSPSLFFLDEATSGLDPGTEAQMMRMLRQLADDGHTIILVTHATKNVTMCDKVIFLARGGYLAYYGPPAEALTYFDVDDFDGIYEKLDGELTPKEWGERYKRTERGSTPVQPPRGSRPGSSSRAGTVATSPRFFNQLAVLSKRYLDIIRRDRMNLIMMLALAPILSLIDFLAWDRTILDPVKGELDNSITMLFLSSLIPFMVGALGTVREVIKEAPIYQRERAAGLSVLPYVISKTWIVAMFALYDAVVFVAVKYIAVDFRDLGTTNIAQHYVTVFLIVLSGSMWGLVLSAFVRREDRAMPLVTALVVFQLVFSGGLLNMAEIGTPGTVLGGVTSVNWGLRGNIAAFEIDSQDCLEGNVSECQLPQVQSFETDAERLVVLNALEKDFSGVMGSNIYATWVGSTAIIGVLFVLFLVLQKRKDKVT
ncbi:MAG: FHA domain-containing protein [Dehalococcoidia bacterium]